jgi:hypothetical protein
LYVEINIEKNLRLSEHTTVFNVFYLPNDVQ